MNSRLKIVELEARIAGDRAAFRDAQKVVRLGIGNQIIAEVLAVRKDLQQDRQGLAIPLEQ